VGLSALAAQVSGDTATITIPAQAVVAVSLATIPGGVSRRQRW